MMLRIIFVLLALFPLVLLGSFAQLLCETKLAVARLDRITVPEDVSQNKQSVGELSVHWVPDRSYDPTLARLELAPIEKNEHAWGWFDFVSTKLKERKQAIKIVFHEKNTQWEYEEDSEEPGKWRLYVMSEKLSENLTLSFVGVLNQVYFEELKSVYGPGWEELIDAEVTHLQQNGYGHWNSDDLRYHVEEILRLRTTWLTKSSFYQQECKHFDWLRDPFQEKLRSARRISSDEEQREIKASFHSFYLFDSTMIDHLWGVSLPGGWELAMIAPPVRRPKKKIKKGYQKVA